MRDHTTVAYWDIPGGRIQLGDSVEDTLRREVEEETGIKDIDNIKPVSMVLSNIRIPLDETESVGLILSVYECEVPEDAEILLSGEHAEYGYFEPAEASILLSIKYPMEFTDLVRGMS